MARKKQISLFDQAKSWKDSDTAKAVGTILAVLLIPASVIAWNYLSKSEANTNIDDKAASTEVKEEVTSEEPASEEVSPEEIISEDEASIVEPEESTEIGGIKVLPDTNSKE